MLRAIGGLLADRLSRWIPDPFVFAICLTILVAILAVVATPSSGLETLQAWYQGFFALLEFGMQITLILTTGYAIALSPLVAGFVDWIANRVNTATKVYVAVIVVGGLFGLVSWGWLVLTAVLARELAQRVDGLDYGYLVACVYFSLMPWVGGSLQLNSATSQYARKFPHRRRLSNSYRANWHDTRKQFEFFLASRLFRSMPYLNRHIGTIR